MRELVITTETSSTKGRSFRAALLAHATCSAFLVGDNIRPIWAMVACSEAESFPFIRNLQSGRKATVQDPSRWNKHPPVFECLKSVDYAWHAQRHPEGVVWTVFLRSLYCIDAGMVDPEGVKFALMPAEAWLSPVDEALATLLAEQFREQGRTYRVAEEHERRLSVCRYITRVAPLFAAYLDRRTRCPLIPDLRFYALVLASMFDAGAATMSHERSEWGYGGVRYEEHDVASVGLARGIACYVSHANLEPLLAECVRTYESWGQVREERKAA